MNWKVFLILAFVVAGGGVGYYYNSRHADSGTQGYVTATSAKDLLQIIKNENAPLTLVNFWASWCEPCKIEFPHILEVRARYLNKGLKVIFVSIDDEQDRLAAENFLRAQKVDFPTYYKGKQPLRFITEIYPQWTGAVPTTLLMSADQKIVDAWEGDTSLEEFEKRVQRQLKGS